MMCLLILMAGNFQVGDWNCSYKFFFSRGLSMHLFLKFLKKMIFKRNRANPDLECRL